MSNHEQKGGGRMDFLPPRLVCPPSVQEGLERVIAESPAEALPVAAVLVPAMEASPPGPLPSPIRNAHVPRPTKGPAWVKRKATFDRAEDMRHISPELADMVKNLLYYHLRHTYIHNHKGRKPKKGWPGRNF